MRIEKLTPPLSVAINAFPYEHPIISLPSLIYKKKFRMSNRAAISQPLIACVESFLSPSLNISSSPSSPALHLIPPPIAAKLKNLGHPRIRNMRTLGHTTQVVSHIPITATPQLCARLNSVLDEGTRMQNDKIVPLALLPSGWGEGGEAARELQRCVTRLGFSGGVFAVSAGLEDKSFDNVWGMAQRLGVPIMLREGWPTGDQVRCDLLLKDVSLG